MRIYSSILEAVKEIERDLGEMGIFNKSQTVQDLNVSLDPDYDSKELQGYCYCVTGFDDLDNIFGFFFKEEELERVRKYCSVELIERLLSSGRNPGLSWKERPEYWTRFLDRRTNKFSYTYSERMGYQVILVINQLKKDRGSRQGIITVYDSCKDIKNLGGVARIPCSMYYQFMVRNISGEDKLIMIYTMRSQDFYTHFAVDIWLAIRLGIYIAEALKVKLYSFTHFIGSLHAFQKDYKNRRVF